MIIELKNPETDETCFVPQGFSWTYLFFGSFVCLLRGDLKWMFISLLAPIFTGGLSQLVLAFMYNALFLEEKLEAGFRPVDEATLTLLKREGISEHLLHTA